MSEAFDLNRRSVARLARQSEHSWQLRLDEDRLITKNIINISRTGMSFKAPGSMALKPGETVHLTVTLSSNETFECEGRISWSKAAPERQGSMQLVGVQFFAIPARYDAIIQEQLNVAHSRERRETPKQQVVASRHIVRAERAVRSFTMKLISGAIIATLTLAFLAAAWMHSRSHPEQDLARKFNEAMVRKLSAVPGD